MSTSKNFRNLVKEIEKLLRDEWDPIGIRDVQDASDEYRTYAIEIAGMILSAASADDIARYLDRVLVDDMGLHSYQRRSRQVAELFSQWSMHPPATVMGRAKGASA